jgi:hypothetical protein
MGSPPAPKPLQEVLPPQKTSGRLTPIERVISRSTFHFEMAACIRALHYGAAALVLAVGVLIHPNSVSISNAAQTLARIWAR